MTTLIPKYYEGSVGAVNRPFNEKLQEYVSIFDFMTPAQIAGVQAHNYSGTDLHTAFQNAFDSAPDSLYIPKGLYPIYQPITITYQTRMYGDGYRFSSLTEGVFIYGSGNFILLTVAARDVIIEGLAFQSGGTGANANTALIYPTIAYPGEKGTYNLRIRDCYFEGGVRQLVASFNPNRLDVQGCHFNANSDTVNCISVVQYDTNGGNPVECYFNNNVFGSITGAVAASSSAIYLDSVDTFTISKNNFQSYFDGAIDIRKTKTYTNNLINIHDNFIEDMQLYSIRVSNASNIWINSNELSGNIGGTAQTAVLATAINRLLINNNIVQGYLFNGINIYDSKMITVSGNTISDIGQDADYTYANIYLNNSDEAAISNNILAGFISQPNNPEAYIKLENTTSKVVISGNEYRNVGVLPLKTDTTPTDIVGYDQSYPYALPYTQSLTFGLVGLSATNQALAIGGTLNLNLPLNTTSGSTGGIAGTLTVSNTWASFFPNNTNAVYAIAGHGTTVTFTPLVSVDGSGAGGAFTVAMSANGVITMTNTSGYVTVATMTFTGSVGIGQ
jgi:parallel beta-helix repeat protein